MTDEEYAEKSKPANFIAWLKSYRADVTYSYGDPWRCLLANYFGEDGVGSRFLFQNDHTTRPLPEGFDDISQQEPWTYGAALKRAEERFGLAECRGWESRALSYSREAGFRTPSGIVKCEEPGCSVCDPDDEDYDQ